MHSSAGRPQESQAMWRAFRPTKCAPQRPSHGRCGWNGDVTVTSSSRTSCTGRASDSAVACSPCSSSSELKCKALPHSCRRRAIASRRAPARSKPGGSPRRPELIGSRGACGANWPQQRRTSCAIRHGASAGSLASHVAIEGGSSHRMQSLSSAISWRSAKTRSGASFHATPSAMSWPNTASRNGGNSRLTSIHRTGGGSSPARSRPSLPETVLMQMA
jgi:hypothetical protein